MCLFPFMKGFLQKHCQVSDHSFNKLLFDSNNYKFICLLIVFPPHNESY